MQQNKGNVKKYNHSDLVKAISDYTEYLKKISNYASKEEVMPTLEIAKEHNELYSSLDINDPKVKKTLVSLSEFIIEHCLFKNKIEYSPFKSLNYEDYHKFLPEMLKSINISDRILADFIYQHRSEAFGDFFSIYQKDVGLEEKIKERLPFFEDKVFHNLFSIKNKGYLYNLYYDYANENKKFDIENLKKEEKIEILNKLFGYSHMSWRDRYDFSNFINDVVRINNLSQKEVVSSILSSEKDDLIIDLLDKSISNENILKEFNEATKFFNVEIFKSYIKHECLNSNFKNKDLKAKLISKLIVQNNNNDSLSFLLEGNNFLLSSNIFFKKGERSKSSLFLKPSQKDLKETNVPENIKNKLNSKFMLIYTNELLLKYNEDYAQMINRNENEMKHFSQTIFRSIDSRLILNDFCILNDILKEKMLSKLIKVEGNNKTINRKKRI